ncbi:radical SAM protein [Candidatus Bathyarchaeota archaeon]|nr:radical SAM protein [Candidatus Bathyarchaeota archaeon]
MVKLANLNVDYRKILNANEEEFEEYLDSARKTSLRNFGNKIIFYAPSFMYYKTSYYCSHPNLFPTISITGSACSLKCKHCYGKVLKTMYPATTPEKLVNLCRKLKAEGALGCLISGGCLPDGSLPLEKFVEAISRIKRELGLTIAVHTGLIRFETAKKLKEAGIDSALLDIIGSDETIREIYRLNASVKDFDASLEALHKAGLAVVPHVLVGLHYGKLKGEIKALEIISKYSPSALIIIAFMPIRGTPMENVKPPSPLDIAKIIVIARLMFPNVPLALGCMRPKGKHRIETDILAIRAGVNAIAFPTEEAIMEVERLGYQFCFSSLCCSQVYCEF